MWHRLSSLWMMSMPSLERLGHTRPEEQTMDDCIFCRIVAGGLPAAKVYEDDHVLAFLDIAPVTPGHVLVIPKRHYPLLTDMPPEEMAALGGALPRISRAVAAATDADGFNIFQSNGPCSGQEIMHAHFHVIARREGDGIGMRPRPGKYGEGELEKCRDRIADRLREDA